MSSIVGEKTCRDVDGNYYAQVKIGDQIWMTENLKTTKYRDGTPIPLVTDNSTWAGLSTGAYSYYDNDPENIISGSITNLTTLGHAGFGNLYNWHAVDGDDGTYELAPEGWHIATDAEWTVLENYLSSSGYGHYVGVDIDDDYLEAYWNFDITGSGDDTLVDLSGNGYSGSLTDAFIRPNGIIGNALNFTSSGHQVDHFPNISMTGSATFTAWFKIAGIGSSEGNKWQYMQEGTTPSADSFGIYMGSDLDVPDDGRLFFAGGGLSTQYVDIGFDAPGDTGSWHFLTIVRNSGSEDNSFSASLDAGLGYPAESGSFIPIGSPAFDFMNTTWIFDEFGSTSGFPLTGSLDEIRIYNKALTPDEIETLYNDPGPDTGQKYNPTWIGKSLADTSGWGQGSDEGDVGNDQASNNRSGFTAVPAGRRGSSGTFQFQSGTAYFWTTTDHHLLGAYWRVMDDGGPDIIRTTPTSLRSGFSVRCIRNN